MYESVSGLKYPSPIFKTRNTCHQQAPTIIYAVTHTLTHAHTHTHGRALTHHNKQLSTTLRCAAPLRYLFAAFIKLSHSCCWLKIPCNQQVTGWAQANCSSFALSEQILCPELCFSNPVCHSNKAGLLLQAYFMNF